MTAQLLDGKPTVADIRREPERGAPMPGGVGPLTRAMWPATVVEAAERNATAV